MYRRRDCAARSRQSSLSSRRPTECPKSAQHGEVRAQSRFLFVQECVAAVLGRVSHENNKRTFLRQESSPLKLFPAQFADPRRPLLGLAHWGDGIYRAKMVICYRALKGGAVMPSAMERIGVICEACSEPFALATAGVVGELHELADPFPATCPLCGDRRHYPKRSIVILMEQPRRE